MHELKKKQLTEAMIRGSAAGSYVLRETAEALENQAKVLRELADTLDSDFKGWIDAIANDSQSPQLT